MSRDSFSCLIEDKGLLTASVGRGAICCSPFQNAWNSPSHQMQQTWFQMSTVLKRSNPALEKRNTESMIKTPHPWLRTEQKIPSICSTSVLGPSSLQSDELSQRQSQTVREPRGHIYCPKSRGVLIRGLSLALVNYVIHFKRCEHSHCELCLLQANHQRKGAPQPRVPCVSPQQSTKHSSKKRSYWNSKRSLNV